MNSIPEMISSALGSGLDPSDLRFNHMLLRALIISVAMLGMMRLAGRRFLAQRSPFDTLLALIIASMLSRAINGSASFAVTIATGFSLAVAYRCIAWCAAKSHAFGKLIKGNPDRLIENGVLSESVMTRHQISEHDLIEDMRLNAALDDVKEVKAAHIERNGAISIQRKPHIFTIGVEKGVQTVRIEVET